MKRILVVDDNEMNRELLVSKIMQYNERNGTSHEILTAAGGHEAVTLCQQERVDLIFMDIVMPGMDGIEATQHIHREFPDTFIVIVSIQGDDENRQLALRKGAQDYLVKPLDAIVFPRRLHLYLKLQGAYDNQLYDTKAVNTFTKKIFTYKTVHTIRKEEGLTQFWEAMLGRSFYNEKVANLSDLVRFVYYLGALQLKRRITFYITVEEDADHLYVSLDHIGHFERSSLEALIVRRYRGAVYRCLDQVVTFMLEKVETEIVPEVVPHESRCAEPTVAVAGFETSDKPLQTYDFLSEEEIGEIKTSLGALSTLMILMGKAEIEEQDVEEIIEHFRQVARVMGIANETFEIAGALNEMIDCIDANRAAFIEQAPQMAELITTFNNDLGHWVDLLFFEGAPSIDFLDASLISNAGTIVSFLQPTELSDQDIDDIFDF